MSTTRGLGRVFRRGGVFWIAYFVKGREYRESSGSAKRSTALALLKRRHEEAGKGRPLHEAQKVLLCDLKNLITGDYGLNRRRSAGRMAQAWAHVAAFFGEKEQAISITAPRIGAYVTARTNDGAAAATVRNELSALKRAFNLARKTGTLLPNEVPAAFPTISVSNARKGFFERGEHDAIKAALPVDEADVAEFLFWTGWRKSEVLGLQWRNVDELAGVLRLDTSKSDEPRTLPFAAVPALTDLMRRRRTVTDEVQRARGRVVSHVFHRNGEPIRCFRRSWLTACVKTGLGYECRADDVRDAKGNVVRKGRVLKRRAYRIPHDYRRSAARNLSRAGVPERVIMAICGWKTRSVFDRYNIVNEADLSAGLAKLAATSPTVEAPKVATIAR